MAGAVSYCDELTAKEVFLSQCGYCLSLRPLQHQEDFFNSFMCYLNKLLKYYCSNLMFTFLVLKMCGVRFL